MFLFPPLSSSLRPNFESCTKFCWKGIRKQRLEKTFNKHNKSYLIKFALISLHPSPLSRCSHGVSELKGKAKYFGSTHKNNLCREFKMEDVRHINTKIVVSFSLFNTTWGSHRGWFGGCVMGKPKVCSRWMPKTNTVSVGFIGLFSVKTCRLELVTLEVISRFMIAGTVNKQTNVDLEIKVHSFSKYFSRGEIFRWRVRALELLHEKTD